MRVVRLGSVGEVTHTPNPARDFLVIRVAGSLRKSTTVDARGAVQVLPLWGKRAGLAPGNYLLRVEVDGRWISGRFTRL